MLSHFLYNDRRTVFSCFFFFFTAWQTLLFCAWKAQSVGNAVTALKNNYITHAPLWSKPWKVLLSRGWGEGEFLVKEQTQFAENDVNKLSVVVLWVPHSVGLHCSDSLCLHDYRKVTILQRADRIALFRTSFFTLQQLDRKWCCNSLKPFNHTPKSTSFSKYHMDFLSLQEAENEILTECFSKGSILCFFFWTGIPLLHSASQTSIFPLFRSSFFSSTSIIEHQRLKEYKLYNLYSQATRI